MSGGHSGLVPPLGELVELEIEDAALDFVTAKERAKQKARELCPDPMLLSWHSGKTGEYWPKFDCGSSEKPPWLVFAEARGANLTIDVNHGEFVFYFLQLA